jgi:hypothetical protein
VQTIKTAIVIVLLLFVLYGGFVALNGTDTPLNPDLQDLANQDLMPDVSGPGSSLSPFGPNTTGPGAIAPASGPTGFDAFNNKPTSSFGSSGGSSATSSPFGTSFPSPPSLPPFPSNSDASVGANNSLLVPTNTANATSPSMLPSLPSGSAPSNLSIPLLPPLPDFKDVGKADLGKSDSIPISTKTPSFGINNSSTNSLPVDLVSSPKETLPSMPSIDYPQNNDPEPSSIDPIKSKTASKSYENAKELAMEQISRADLKEALATLSTFYNAPELTSEQRQDLLDLLDALTREVVFSRRHFLETAHVVAPAETMTDVSKRYDVPAEILARINAIDPTSQLPIGAKLKVVPGPFRAEVDLNRSELTLFVGDLYAGRYPVSLGNDPSPKSGPYQVIEKQRSKNYYGNGVQISAADPRNPYGGFWIDLGQDLCIHGTSENPTDSKLGCISLSPLDASDVFGMLSRGSPVTIRK